MKLGVPHMRPSLLKPMPVPSLAARNFLLGALAVGVALGVRHLSKVQ